MTLTEEQMLAYLERMGFASASGQGGALPAPTLDTLIELQSLHPHNVLFENLSILVPEWRELDMAPTGLKLDLPSLYEKVVTRRRGGYCFELNTLFAALLQGLGFSVYSGQARVARDGLMVDPSLEANAQHHYTMTPLSHMILFVSGGQLPTGHTYLVDVGFGGNTLTAPVLIQQREELEQQGWEPPAQGEGDPHTFHWRLRWGACGRTRPAVPEDIDQGYYLQVWARQGQQWEGTWHDLYYFTRAPFTAWDYDAANFYTSCHPGTLFTQLPFCTKPDREGGRLILLGTSYKYRNCFGESSETVVQSMGELRELLASKFGAELPAEVALAGLA